MGEAGFPSLVVLSVVELICLVSSYAEFSLLIVVYNIGVQSLRTELCSLRCITFCGCLVLVLSLTVMNPNGSFDVLLVWTTVRWCLSVFLLRLRVLPSVGGMLN